MSKAAVIRFECSKIEPSQIRFNGVHTLTASTPIYVTLDSAKVAETRELIEGRVYADFDAAGNLIGVEVVG